MSILSPGPGFTCPGFVQGPVKQNNFVLHFAIENRNMVSRAKHLTVCHVFVVKSAPVSWLVSGSYSTAREVVNGAAVFRFPIFSEVARFL